MVMSVFPSALAYADGDSAPTVPVQVSKVDADGTALKGTQLRIPHKDANGADVIDAEWTSDGTVHTTDLPAGDYTLTETTTPEGYDKAADQTFTRQGSRRSHPDERTGLHESRRLSHPAGQPDHGRPEDPSPGADAVSTVRNPVRRSQAA